MDSKHTVTVNFHQLIHFKPLSPLLNTLLYQIMIFLELIHQMIGQIEPTLEILPFFLYVILKLFWHISGLYDTKYQMSICDDEIKGPQKSI